MFGRQPLSTAPFCALDERQIIDSVQRLRAQDFSTSFIQVRELSGNFIRVRDESEGSA